MLAVADLLVLYPKTGRYIQRHHTKRHYLHLFVFFMPVPVAIYFLAAFATFGLSIAFSVVRLLPLIADLPIHPNIVCL